MTMPGLQSVSDPLVSLVAALFVFLLALTADYLSARYVAAITSRQRHLAARCSVGMWLVSATGLVAFLAAGWPVLVAEGAGLYLGTLLAIRS
jgi:hypothetical protein